MNDHTTTPWQISDVRTTEDTAMIVGGEGFEFGLIADVTEDFDAAFIVKVVNNHDALVQALQALVNQVNDYERVNNLAPTPGRTECWDTVARAKEVLGVVGSPGLADRKGEP